MASSCNSAKSTTNNQDSAAADSTMIADGFVAATVMLNNTESGCPVLLVFENGEKLDPINLDESLAIDQTILWVKFSRLRMPPRCDVASAISITKAQKKAE